MSVGQAITHPLQIHGMGSSADQKARVLDLMEKVGLSPAEFLYRKYPHQLSGGQSQRVVIARALATRPDFLVADEPIAMADVSVRALILQLMRQLKEEMGLTYLFITHDLATAKYLCDRVAVMYLGRIVETASRDQLFSRAHHPYTKALLAAVPVPDPRPGGKEPSPGRDSQRHRSARGMPFPPSLSLRHCEVSRGAARAAGDRAGPPVGLHPGLARQAAPTPDLARRLPPWTVSSLSCE